MGKQFVGAALAVLVMLSLIACSSSGVSQEEYDALKEELEALQEQQAESGQAGTSTTVPSDAVSSRGEDAVEAGAGESADAGVVDDKEMLANVAERVPVVVYVDRESGEAVITIANTTGYFFSGYVQLSLMPDIGETVEAVVAVDNLPTGGHMESRVAMAEGATTVGSSREYISPVLSDQPVDNTGTLDETTSALANAKIMGLTFDGILGAKVFQTDVGGYVIVTVSTSADAWNICYNALAVCTDLEGIDYEINTALVVDENGTILQASGT